MLNNRNGSTAAVGGGALRSIAAWGRLRRFRPARWLPQLLERFPLRPKGDLSRRHLLLAEAGGIMGALPDIQTERWPTKRNEIPSLTRSPRREVRSTYPARSDRAPWRS